MIDSLQEYEIRYYYEQIYSERDFESFKNRLLSKSSTKNDSFKITKHIIKLKKIQQERLNNDTLQFCKIIFTGEPIDFKFKIGGEDFEFTKSDFVKIRIPDDFPQFENQCKIALFKKSNKIVMANFESNNLSYDCILNLSFSTIKIENNINIPLSEITTKSDTDGGPPIPIEKTVIVRGAIEINHTWSY